MKNESKNYDVAKVGKFIIFLLLIHFLFFGYIANVYEKEPGDNLLYIYLSTINKESWLSLLILAIILILQAFSEDLLVYSMKTNLLAVPFIFVFSLIWYGINYETLSMNYFSSAHALTNILFLLLIAFVTALIGAYFRAMYRNMLFKRRSMLL